MENDTTRTSEFLIWGRTFLEKILSSDETKKSKWAGLWESQSWMRVGTLAIWVKSFNIEKI